jgi:hypothetical protein
MQHQGVMPLEYDIDHGRRLVTARGRGILTYQEMVEYQCAVWSRPDVDGYDELVDMTAVEDFAQPSTDRIRELASLSSVMDGRRTAKFAIVAPGNLAYGLGRMYQTYRGLEGSGTKDVGVFRTMAEALVFLGTGRNAPAPAPEAPAPPPD